MTANNNGYGVYVSSSNNTITQVVAYNNTKAGISINKSSGNLIKIGNISENTLYDIFVITSAAGQCSNNFTDINGSGNRVIGYYGGGISTYGTISLENQSFSQLVLCNMNSTLKNITISGSDTKNNNGLFMIREQSSGLKSNINSSENYYGIYAESNSGNVEMTNITANNNIYGFYFSSALYAFTMANIAVNNNSVSGIYLSGSNNHIFRDGNLSLNANDITLTATSLNNTFLNLSYNISRESVASGSRLLRKWYYQAYVNDSQGNPVSMANVTAYNVTGNYQFNLTTNSSGWTKIGEIIDYVNFGGTKAYYSNHFIDAGNKSNAMVYGQFNSSLRNNFQDAFSLITSCLNYCTEGQDCNITSSCYLNSQECSGNICDFGSFRINASVNTLYKYLELNLSGNITFFGAGSHFVFSGKNFSIGGNGSFVNISVPDLFNTTNARFVGLGGYSAVAGAGGNGGTLVLNYRGLLRKFTDLAAGEPDNTPLLTAGNSTNSTIGTGGSIVYHKSITCNSASNLYRDADINDDGLIDVNDTLVIKQGYGNVSSDSTFNSTYDINCDDKLNVADLAREGFEYSRGVLNPIEGF